MITIIPTCIMCGKRYKQTINKQGNKIYLKDCDC